MADSGPASPSYTQGGAAESLGAPFAKRPASAKLVLGHGADGAADDTWLSGGGSQQSTTAPVSPASPVAPGRVDRQITSSSVADADELEGLRGDGPATLSHWEASSTVTVAAMGRLHGEATRLMLEADHDGSLAIATERVQARRVRSRLREKILDTQGLISNLESRLGGVSATAKLVRDSIAALEKAHRAKRPLLTICERRLEIRASRPQQELVNDHFQEALEQEKHTLDECRQDLAGKIQESSIMLATLENMRGMLQEDLHHKRHSCAIDRTCHRPRPDAVGGRGQIGRCSSTPRARASRVGALPTLPGMNGVQAALSPKGEVVGTGREHERSRQSETLALVDKAWYLELRAARLINENDVAMLDAEREAGCAGSKTEASMVRRIEETQDLRRRLEVTLHDTDASISATEQSLAKTKKRLEANEKPLEELRRQMSLRGRRTSREDIHDHVSDEMAAQLETLQGAVRTLTKKWQAGTSMADQLRAGRLQLTEDIRLKSLALRIDESCARITQRKAFDLEQKKLHSCRPSTARRKPALNMSAGSALRGS